MAEPARIVRLLKNETYPTFQLYAQMTKKAPPAEGLGVAVRTVLDWLLERLGENAAPELRELAAREEPFFSYHESCGYGIDVVYLPESGAWSLRITEPDLGSNPGDPKQSRQPVPGRVLETNVGFRISGSRLECGFQTVVSDPSTAGEDAEVYRLSPVRRLVENPDFGLTQLTELTGAVLPLASHDAVRALTELWRHRDNQLPCVVFTPPSAEAQAPDLRALERLAAAPRPGSLPGLPLPAPAVPADRPAFDAEGFARSCFALCRTYRLKEGLFDRFRASVGAPLQPGDIAVLCPEADGGEVRVVGYTPLKSRQAEVLQTLRGDIFAYPRRKERSFGGVAFLSEARQRLRTRAEELEQQTEETRREWEERLVRREAELRAELRSADERIAALEEQKARLLDYQAQLGREKDELRRGQEDVRREEQKKLEKKDLEIAYLRRCLARPREHGEIAAWASENFGGRLLLHPKAVDLLADRSARTVPIALICDGLDFLATDYWDFRYLRISREEMNGRCSVKYGRPFEIKPTGEQTVAYTPGQYKIKYFPGARGKPVESPLDYHLRTGNDMENLLRIYFLHDDEKRLIVVGSLPRHLRTVSIQ